MPTKLLTEQALVPLRWSSAGVYSQENPLWYAQPANGSSKNWDGLRISHDVFDSSAVLRPEKLDPMDDDALLP
ncbi:hypothetical protein LA080_002905 [Diaporthe eres]|nr:hypothetical protein LA080_002905 [Diaporthe eres]